MEVETLSIPRLRYLRTKYNLLRIVILERSKVQLGANPSTNELNWKTETNLNVLVLGDPEVGKSSLIWTFLDHCPRENIFENYLRYDAVRYEHYQCKSNINSKATAKIQTKKGKISLSIQELGTNGI
jgi:hypothetical protein